MKDIRCQVKLHSALGKTFVWFTMHVNLFGAAEVYVNYDAEMALTVTNLGVLSNGAGQAYTYMTGSGESTYLYRYLE